MLPEIGTACYIAFRLSKSVGVFVSTQNG